MPDPQANASLFLTMSAHQTRWLKRLKSPFGRSATRALLSSVATAMLSSVGVNARSQTLAGFGRPTGLARPRVNPVVLGCSGFGDSTIKSKTEVRGSGVIFDISIFSPRRSSKTSKPPSHNSAKSRVTWAWKVWNPKRGENY